MSRLIDLFYNRYNYTDFHELNLSWLLEDVKKLIIALDNMEEWKSQHEAEYKELKKLYDDILAGNFPDSMVEKLREWTIKNTTDIIGAAIKTVLFELTPDGHLLVIIPDSWDDILFGTTGLDTFPAGYTFGHLTLTY